jgi:hypothetical protein
MPPADTLGTVLIEVRAKLDELTRDLDRARSDAESKLQGVEGTAKLGLDSDVEAGADEADAQLEGVEGEAQLGLDASDVEGGADAADAQLEGIEGEAQLGLDWGDFEGAVAAADSMLDGIEGTAVLGIDTSDFEGGVAGAQAQLDSIDAKAPGRQMGQGFDEGGAMAAGAVGGVAGGMKGLAGMAAGFVGIRTFGGFIADAREANKSVASLEQQLQVTGAGAWTSTEAIQALASGLQDVTGISDEVTEGAAAWLTSFKNVKNESGELNNVFDRTILVSADLAARMGTDMFGATTQLGKALNDPIKGLGSLSRAGVQFTAQQKEQITTMVEAGDILGAQRLILAELEGQVGGSAKAMADSGDLMSAKLADVSEAMGIALVPAMDAFAAVAMPVLDIFLGLPGPIQAAVVVVLGLTAGALALSLALGPLVLGLGMTGVAGGAAAGGLGAAAAALWAVAAPVLLVVGVLALLGLAIWALIAHWDTLVAAVGVAWDWITGKVGGAADWLQAKWLQFAAALAGVWESIKGKAAEAWDWITGKVGQAADWISAVPGRIGEAFRGIWASISDGAKAAFNWVARAWNSTLGSFGFTVPDWVPGLGGRRFSMPQMPQLAEGGEILESGFAIVGERGPEVRWFDKGNVVSPIVDGGNVRGGGGGDPPPIAIYPRAMLGTKADVLRWVEEGLAARGYGSGRR